MSDVPSLLGACSFHYACGKQLYFSGMEHCLHLVSPDSFVTPGCPCLQIGHLLSVDFDFCSVFDTYMYVYVDSIEVNTHSPSLTRWTLARTWQLGAEQ